MDRRIAWVTAEIEQRLSEPIDVPRLAAQVNLSTSRFAHLFRAETGVSPMRFVRSLRMERARLLLERTFLSVKEVMAQVGCSDPSHFARDFRRCHGIAPREWRTALGNRSAEWEPGARTAAADVQQDTPTKSVSRQKTHGA